MGKSKVSAEKDEDDEIADGLLRTERGNESIYIPTVAWPVKWSPTKEKEKFRLVTFSASNSYLMALDTVNFFPSGTRVFKGIKHARR